MVTRLFAVIVTILLFNCSPTEPKLTTAYKGIQLTPFCDLPKKKNQKVFTRAIYSGEMEYWSLSSPDSCKSGYQVDLDIRDLYVDVPLNFKRVFNNRQSFKYIIVEAVGVFETGRQEGYGHQGSNNARFLVSELVQIRGVKY
jgi:hypothetical protein